MMSISQSLNTTCISQNDSAPRKRTRAGVWLCVLVLWLFDLFVLRWERWDGMWTRMQEPNLRELNASSDCPSIPVPTILIVGLAENLLILPLTYMQGGTLPHHPYCLYHDAGHHVLSPGLLKRFLLAPCSYLLLSPSHSSQYN